MVYAFYYLQFYRKCLIFSPNTSLFTFHHTEAISLLIKDKSVKTKQSTIVLILDGINFY